MINVGDTIPDMAITIAGADEHQTTSTKDFFNNKKVVMFAVPGAFTPTCSAAHLPGYVVAFDSLKAKGIDTVACLAVNDAFVMQAWSQAQNAENITMIADGGGALTKTLGLELATADFGGTRSQRYAMVVDNGIVTQLNVEEGHAFEASSAETMLASL